MWFLDKYYSNENPNVSVLSLVDDKEKQNIYGFTSPPKFSIDNKYDDNNGLLSNIAGAVSSGIQQVVGEVASLTAIGNKAGRTGDEKNAVADAVEGISTVSQIKILKTGDLNKKFKSTTIGLSLNFKTIFVQDEKDNYEIGFKSRILTLVNRIANRYNSSADALKDLTGLDLKIELFAGFISPPNGYVPGNALITDNNPGTFTLQTPYGVFPNLLITSASVDYPETKCDRGPAYMQFDLTLEPAKTVTKDYLINSQKTMFVTSA